jgi:hypothetical protein
MPPFWIRHEESLFRRWSCVVRYFADDAYTCAFADDVRRMTYDADLVLQLLSNISQRRPARIFHRFCAVALFQIQVLAAMRAQAAAIVAANRLQWER